MAVQMRAGEVVASNVTQNSAWAFVLVILGNRVLDLVEMRYPWLTFNAGDRAALFTSLGLGWVNLWARVKISDIRLGPVSIDFDGIPDAPGNTEPGAGA
jgi:hypothetical protein